MENRLSTNFFSLFRYRFMLSPFWGVNRKPINEGGSPLAGGVLIFGED
jgi:hypothetical protein